MQAIITLALKDIKILLRDKAALFWIIGFPFIMALFFGAIFNSSDDDSVSALQIVIVDEDNTDYSRKYIENISASDMLSVTPATADSAFNLVRKGKKTAFIKINKGFTEAQMKFSKDSAYLEIGVDPAKRFSSALINGMVTKASFEMMMFQFNNPQSMMDEISKSKNAIDSSSSLTSEEKVKYRKFFTGLEGFIDGFDLPFMIGSIDSATGKSNSFMSGPKIKKVNVAKAKIGGPSNSYEITFPSSILWVLIGCSSGFAISIVNEKTGGTYTRLRIAPITRAQILAGKGLSCFITSISVSCLLLLFGNLVFDVNLDNYLFLSMALISSVLCFVGLMMFISVIGKTEQSVAGAGMAIMLIMAMTGGGMIPLFVMPSWMITVSNFSFVKWGIVALEGAIWRGYSMSEMMLPVAVLVTSGIILFTIGVTILTKRDG